MSAIAGVIGGWVGPGLALGGAIAGLITWYVRDRRKSVAEAALIEQSTDADVDLRDTGARDARLVYVQRQIDMERAFHLQQIADRDAEIERQRAEIVHRDEQISHRDERILSLLTQVGGLQVQLGEMTRQLTFVRSQLVELTVHDPHPPNGDVP